MSNIKQKNILVTGGAGFIGSELTNRLLSENAKVTVVDNLINGKVENLETNRDNLKFFNEDIRNYDLMEKLIANTEFVFHLASMGIRHSLHSPLENHEVNAEGTLNLLKISETNKSIKFVHISTSEVYGKAHYVPMDERHPTLVSTVYGGSKLAGESYVRAFNETFNLDCVVIRPFNSYGPNAHHEGDCGEVIPKFIIRALTNNPLYIFGDGEQTRDFTYVSDSADAIIKIGTNYKRFDTFNVGSEKEISINQLANLIIKLTDSKSEIIHIEPRPGDVLRLHSDSTKAFDKFNLKHKNNLEQGLEKLIDWYKGKELESLIEEDEIRNWEK
mgnify:CR=1 FL=1|tara:strand:+ start:15007 stop:15996 length:990 start_codon:yes stop_codon:yes gene_type:complete